MKQHNLFTYLCCPVCKGSIFRKKNIIRCRRCTKKYSVKKGIPILIDLHTLPIHLQKQITYFEKEDQGRIDFHLEPWQKRYVDNFLHFGVPKSNGVIIDNATGSGYMPIELAKKGFFIIATDLTLAELIKLHNVVKKKHLEKNILLVCCTSEALPIKSEKADGLIANAILEHLPKEREAIAEINRVVKKNSPVMLAMPLAYRYILPFLWIVNFIHDRRIGHLRRYTQKNILLKFSKFSEVTTYYTGYLPKVVCLAAYRFTHNSMWLTLAEHIDRIGNKFPYGANNIVMILKKL